MSLNQVLEALNAAGLVKSVAAEPEPEYLFRHGLLQETAYELLLKRQRRRLHKQVGLAIEHVYSERTEELAPILANHFLRSDDQEKALQYLTLAGESARSQYANAEALEYFTSGIEIAHELDRPKEAVELRRERGLTHEIMGNFKKAQRDFNACLKFGRQQPKADVQWSALLDLGRLWAAKDYEKTGKHFKQALSLARQSDDSKMIARSLNRLGNWHINVGNPARAKSHHREALEIFEAMEDREGVAETLDFLGMSAMISSDVQAGTNYYERAIDLLRTIEDKQRLTSSLTTYALRFYSTMAEATVGAKVGPEVALADFSEAIELSRELGWKAGEAFALWARAFLLNSLGRLDEAQSSGKKAFKLASDINHIQWLAGVHCALSRTYLEKMNLTAALEHAKQGWKKATDSGSRLWCGLASAHLALTHLADDELDQAAAALGQFAEEDPAMEMLGDRAYWMAKAELRFQQGRYEQAIDILRQLIEAAPNFEEGVVIPRLFRTQGRAYLELEELNKARQLLQEAIDYCQHQSLKVLLWRLHGDFAQLEAKADRQAEAEEALEAGRTVVQKIAANLSDPADRQRFKQRALQDLNTLAAVSTPS